MPETITLLLAFVIALAIGTFIGKIVFSSKSASDKKVLEERNNSLSLQIEQLKQQFTNEKLIIEKQILQLQEERNDLRMAKDSLAIQLTKKETDFDNLMERVREQRQETEELREKFTKEFENLANKILDEKSTKFTEQNRENIKNILSPLQEKIQLFESKVESTHKESIDYHAALREQIVGLSKMNEQMSRETLNLTKALKGDSKMQGNWGELILERVLEKSGLEKDREYFVQQSHTNEEGARVLPDVVINLPDGKKMVVDSKVSLVAYERYVNEEDDPLRLVYLKEHVNSIKRHIDQLGEKNYQDLYKMESPDFVLLFIPIESAFASALNEDTTLYNKAFERNIVIVTPSTLLATLRTIDSMWTNQKQQENAYEIARQAGALYDKFVGFTEDLIMVGKRMDEGKKAYEGAMGKLVGGRGNIITSIGKLKKMGAKAKKSLPENIVNRALQNDEQSTEDDTDNLLNP
ncbi:DNA recombination protein RmuC [Flavobacterium salilacus subsp. salilacus]|uniref:DNA recombination protein RmuC n=1 Tax=Flavobacterium TaxID=237 RepID=UPI00107523D7|nr:MULTISPECIES: DNA recombination protein RmuC [Flavobacterium]KAF2518479.1 DNA recombination protein RmuC [Flavobacterium salilacus subsp. salilacus]MBE1615118.1 DNA recombination protein RmuC [Flavobacterium sp. SaA2.13]